MSKTDTPAPAPAAPPQVPVSIEPTPVVMSDGTKRIPTDTVLIGCKLPHGITLELVPATDPPSNMSESEAFAYMMRRANSHRTGPRVTLKGSNSLREKTVLDSPAQGTHLYGITRIDRDFWREWHAKHGQGLKYVREGHVFELTHEDRASLKAATDERRDLKTGLEALNPDMASDGRMKDERIRKIAQPGLPETRVATDEQRLAEAQARAWNNMANEYEL